MSSTCKSLYLLRSLLVSMNKQTAKQLAGNIARFFFCAFLSLHTRTEKYFSVSICSSDGLSFPECASIDVLCMCYSLMRLRRCMCVSLQQEVWLRIGCHSSVLPNLSQSSNRHPDTIPQLHTNTHTHKRCRQLSPPWHCHFIGSFSVYQLTL